MYANNANKKVAKLIQVVVATPDGRVLVRKEKVLVAHLSNSDEYCKWDLTVRSICYSSSPEDTAAMVIKNYLGVSIDKTRLESVGVFKAGPIAAVTNFDSAELWCVDVSDSIPILFDQKKRDIIAVPFDDLIDAVHKKPAEFTFNTKSAVSVLYDTDKPCG